MSYLHVTYSVVFVSTQLVQYACPINFTIHTHIVSQTVIIFQYLPSHVVSPHNLFERVIWLHESWRIKLGFANPCQLCDWRNVAFYNAVNVVDACRSVPPSACNVASPALTGLFAAYTTNVAEYFDLSQLWMGSKIYHSYTSNRSDSVNQTNWNYLVDTTISAKIDKPRAVEVLKCEGSRSLLPLGLYISSVFCTFCMLC